MQPPAKHFPGPGRFTAICRWTALPLLVLIALLGQLIHLNSQEQFVHASAEGVTTPAEIPADFPQFYMGGVIARYGIWGDMYPIPTPGSPNNPGEPADSTSRPEYQRLAYLTGVRQAFRYILSPPAALLLYPISLFPYRIAALLWLGLNYGAAWGVARLAAAFYGKLVGRPTYMQGLLLLLVALAPQTRRSTNPGNLSPMIALLIGLSIWSMLHNEQRRTALWMVLGAVLKYVTAVFFPMLIAMRRWRSIAWVVGIGVAMLAVSVAIMGTGPFVAYVQLFPSLNRPFIGPARFNQTVYGVAWEFYHQTPLPVGVTRVIHLVQLAVLGLVLLLIFRRKRADWQNPAVVMGAAASLMMWMLLFSPVVWIHYVMYVSVFYGWVVWEALQPKAGWPARIAALIATLFLWIPYSGGDGPLALIHQPMMFHVFYAELTVFAIALRRMTLPSTVPEETIIQTQRSIPPTSEELFSRRSRVMA